ncbi:zinc-binding dehydrogenase [Tsukamurella soli]|uniref:zinc-binding dehydrogenase n=1 Tax=Tsukamurella soli TaxID=644556 RepID=UPI003606272F
MTTPVPAATRVVTLIREPTGTPRADDFAVVERPLAEPGPGAVVVRVRAFRVSASLLAMVGGGRERRGVPFPPVAVGDALYGAAMGTVLAAPSGGPITVGDTVIHHLGWRDYAVLPVRDCRMVPADVSPAVALGFGGTAYAALTRGTRVHPGDTVLVTAGGSAIGAMAGQIARILGAGRVLATASDRSRGDRLMAELGYDAVVTRDRPLDAQLGQAAPDGLDVVIDNVGGEQLAAAVRAARPHARYVLLGSLAGQLGGDSTVQLDGGLFAPLRITLRGYSSDDDPDAEAEWRERSAAWIADGQLVPAGATVGDSSAPPRR